MNANNQSFAAQLKVIDAAACLCKTVEKPRGAADKVFDAFNAFSAAIEAASAEGWQVRVWHCERTLSVMVSKSLSPLSDG